MATVERAGDEAPPHGIPRPQWLVRFFDEDGTLVAGRRFFDPVSVELCAARTLGKSLGGRVACLARFFVTDGDGWVATGEEMEY